jgi:hypothetical protein
MIIDSIQTIVFLLAAAGSYYAWRRYQDRDYLQLAWIGGVGILLKGCGYLSNAIPQIPIELRVIDTVASMIAAVVLILLILKIVFRSYKK